MKRASIIVPITKNNYQGIDGTFEFLTTLSATDDIEIICAGQKDLISRISNDTPAHSGFVIAETEAGNIAGCLNAGSDKAEGKYIGFTLPGDTVSSEVYRKLISVSEENGTDIISCTDTENDLCNKLLKKEDMPKLTCLNTNCFCSLFKRSFIYENRIRFTETGREGFAGKIFYWKALVHAKEAMLICEQDHTGSMGKICDVLSGPDDVYEINKTYDQIKTALSGIEDNEIRNRFMGYYCKSKLNDYSRVLDKLTGNTKMHFWDRFCKEMQRSSYLGEIDNSVLSEKEKGQISMILEYPSGINVLEEKITVLSEKNAKQQKTIEEQCREIVQKDAYIAALEGSTAYRVGLAATVLPRKIKDRIKQG